jgi:Flp pilus assembly protein TadB
MVDRFKAAKLKPPEQKALRVKRAAVVRYLAVSGAIMVTILLIVWISLLFRRPVLIIIGWTLIITQILCRGYLKWVLESYSRKNIEYWKDLMKIERQKKPPATPGKRR